MAASMLVEPRDIVTTIVARRRRWCRRVAARVGSLAARNPRLDAVGCRIVRRRPALFPSHIVRRQNAGLPSPLPARPARFRISAQQVAEVDDEPELRREGRLGERALRRRRFLGRCVRALGFALAVLGAVYVHRERRFQLTPLD